MTVKADSKGRLTGAQPETRYTRKEHPDGRIEYAPEIPRDFDRVMDVSQEKFEEFFQAPVKDIVADAFKNYELFGRVRGDNFFGQGLVFETFKVDSHGNYVRAEDTGRRVSERTLIRIVKSEK